MGRTASRVEGGHDAHHPTLNVGERPRTTAGTGPDGHHAAGCLEVDDRLPVERPAEESRWHRCLRSPVGTPVAAKPRRSAVLHDGVMKLVVTRGPQWAFTGSRGYCSTRSSRSAGFSLQANVKTLEGAQHPDRDAQFHYVNEQVKDHQADGEPVISVDTKKWEHLGRLPMAGRKASQRRARPRVQHALAACGINAARIADWYERGHQPAAQRSEALSRSSARQPLLQELANRVYAEALPLRPVSMAPIPCSRYCQQVPKTVPLQRSWL